MGLKDDDIPPAWGEWMGSHFGNPFRYGPGGVFLTLFAVVGMVYGGILGLDFFPPGHYPRLILLIPGLVSFLVTYFVGGIIVYQIERMLWRWRVIRWLLWTPGMAGCLFLGFLVGRALVGMVMKAF